MKRRVLTSIAASIAIVGVIGLAGCGSSSSPKQSNPGGTDNPGQPSQSDDRNVMISIEKDDGTRATVDPTTGGTVIIGRDENSSTNKCVTVVPSPLNKCANATTDGDGDGIICGPKENVTYGFISDFGKLGGPTGNGDNDGNASTPDGGVLLYSAYTEVDGSVLGGKYEANASENRIESVYIPANYIKVTDDFKTRTLDEQYDAMRTYLENVCNMKCFATENTNDCCDNPYFTDGKTKGEFVATFVMHFTRGESYKKQIDKFKTDTTDLEYLTVTFRLDVEQVDNDSSKLRFTSPAGTKVVFGAKRKGQGGLIVETDNDVINSVLHESTYVDEGVTINMAKYFDKVIAKGEALNVADVAKEILVENAQHPWPVKIFGTLHEIKDDGTVERSFVRNPGKLNAPLYGLTAAGAYNNTFDNDPDKQAKAESFCIVYPNGDYNKLED